MIHDLLPPDVAFVGRARTGKDSAAEILSRKWGHKRLAFADPLRELALRLNPLVSNGFSYRQAIEWHGYEKAKDLYPELRRVLQDLGVGVRDIIGPDTWVSMLLARVTDLPDAQPVAVSDVRFENEIAALRQAGFVIVRLTRLAADNADRHVSATELDGVRADFTFANDSSLEALEAFLDGVVLTRPRHV